MCFKRLKNVSTFLFAITISTVCVTSANAQGQVLRTSTIDNFKVTDGKSIKFQNLTVSLQKDGNLGTNIQTTHCQSQTQQVLRFTLMPRYRPG